MPDACTRSVYVTCSGKICGKYHYQPGCVLVTGCSNDGLPDLAFLRTVAVVDSLKYFVNEELNTCSFETNFHQVLLMLSVMLCFTVQFEAQLAGPLLMRQWFFVSSSASLELSPEEYETHVNKLKKRDHYGLTQ